jgi:hypothetical protein
MLVFLLPLNTIIRKPADIRLISFTAQNRFHSDYALMGIVRPFQR